MAGAALPDCAAFHLERLPIDLEKEAAAACRVLHSRQPFIYKLKEETLPETAVQFSHISMEFPGVLANDDVSLEIHKGEVFALIGENGAGKSTLMNTLYGINKPTNGDVYIRGKKVERYDPGTAIAMGVGMVHQHFKLVDAPYRYQEQRHP